MALNPQQIVSLQDISRSVRTTCFGAAWPHEFANFFYKWGYFNAIYNTLYDNHEEWRRVVRFSLDARLSGIWDHHLKQNQAVDTLARQPCIGDGRDNFEPQEHVRIAFSTLRREFGVDLSPICNSPKCRRRKSRCVNFTNGAIPQPIDPSTLDHAKYTAFGATLIILYQIRNNLFHGSKTEISKQLERNILLTRVGSEILEVILNEFIRLLPLL